MMPRTLLYSICLVFALGMGCGGDSAPNDAQGDVVPLDASSAADSKDTHDASSTDAHVQVDVEDITDVSDIHPDIEAPDGLTDGDAFFDIEDAPTDAQPLDTEDPQDSLSTTDLGSWDAAELPPTTVAVTEPTQIDFAPVALDKSSVTLITMQNMGTHPLVVSSVALSGANAFSAQIAGQQITTESPSISSVVAPPGGTITIQVRFKPNDYEPVTGTLVFVANTLAASTGQSILLSGSTSSPCISVTPLDIDFGLQLTGGALFEEAVEITNCGPNPLNVHRISMSSTDDLNDPLLSDLGLVGPSPDFNVIYPEGASAPSTQEPWLLESNESRAVSIQYTTPAFAPPFNNEAATPSTQGDLIIESDAYHAAKKVSVVGSFLDSFCPIPQVDAYPGQIITVGTTVTLNGNSSIGILGAIESYEWSVVTPTGEQEAVVQDETGAVFQYTPLEPGDHLISLRVYDETGLVSCETASLEIQALTGPQIEIKLTWHDTEGNVIKGPNAADLDLHFVHPDAVGVDGDLDGTPDGYFDLVYDCFWYNSIPTWSTEDPNANPTLSVDASSEGGPETTILQSPEDNLSYRVGVHYYPGVSTAPQVATLKIYSQEQALWESPPVTLSPGDLWDAATLDWPQKQVTPNQSSSGAPKVTPNYPAPF